MKAASGKTYQSSKKAPDGSREELFIITVMVLFWDSNLWNNTDGSYGRSFENIEREWLGDSFNDPANGYTSSFSSVELKNDAGKLTGYKEVGSSKQVDADGNTIFERTFEYIFDTSWELQSGTETEGLTTRTLGKNWEIVKESLLEIFQRSVIITLAFLMHNNSVDDKDDTTDDKSLTKILVKTFQGGNIETSFFDTSGKLLGTSYYYTEPGSFLSAQIIMMLKVIGLEVLLMIRKMALAIQTFLQLKRMAIKSLVMLILVPTSKLILMVKLYLNAL